MTLGIAEPGKRWLLTRKKVAFDLRWSGCRDYPEKGDLISLSPSSKDLSQRYLGAQMTMFKITRKKVTFCGAGTAEEEYKKILRKNEEDDQRDLLV